jgi:hypothetical protein
MDVDEHWAIPGVLFRLNGFLLASDLSGSELKTGENFIFQWSRKNSRIKEHAAWTVASLSVTTAARWGT